MTAIAKLVLSSVVLLVAAGPLPAGANDAQRHGPTAMQENNAVRAGDLEISKGFVRPMLPGQPVGGGYLTLTNTGKSDDVLISASSPSSGAVELHEMAMEGQVMKMRKLNDGIPLPAGKKIELRPGGLHLMFMKVAEPFKTGDQVPLTLVFEKAGKVDVVLPVGSSAAPAGAH